jgi:uncharacterized membrane protein YkvA (DUF1232 family)
MLKRLLQWANLLKREVVTLWFCTRHPQAPLAVKLLALLIVAYAFSPIDLIPDFIPVLGYLDEIILLPIGIWVALKLMPQPAVISSRAQAEQWLAEKHAKPRNWFGAALVVVVWLAAMWLTWQLFAQWLPGATLRAPL